MFENFEDSAISSEDSKVNLSSLGITFNDYLRRVGSKWTRNGGYDLSGLLFINMHKKVNHKDIVWSLCESIRGLSETGNP